MRGAGDQFSVGERVTFYRRRRGLTQRVLADLVGRSEDWLSKIERGERELRRLDVIAELAQALRVSVGDLLGQPVLVEAREKPDHEDIPAIRTALMNHRRLSTVLFPDQTRQHPPRLDAVEQLTTSSRRRFLNGELGDVIAVLPRLITEAQNLEDGTAQNLHHAFALSSRIHHLASSTLTKVGEADLAWIAAERAMAAADRSSEPRVIAAAARAGASALMAIGRFDDSLQVASQAARWIGQQVGSDARTDPVVLSLSGMLYLRSAEAAALAGDRQTAYEMLEMADQAAKRLGADANYWQTNFGPTNVMLHRVSIGLDLDDIATVLNFGPDIDASKVTSERAASWRIHLAHAFAVSARDDEALGWLLAAQEDAAQLVWHSALARETVRSLYRRSVGRNQGLVELAERCRAIA
ncbi:helix-turn-helix domain-containing protein [Microlunatus parietis]|uniref:Transcriptional regulator with XRE-family HTH domain n=1 Tax=Microlunatus parietis TaxID=682979 RepID=A0A7Y9IFB6_9ACTN|nr:helix-turn-helix transcriptional regulator [Microlunatus parietis]NYE75606.1 transcriptional regulator with XRE-family HTH domain [Microlunatus parietis]